MNFHVGAQMSNFTKVHQWDAIDGRTDMPKVRGAFYELANTDRCGTAPPCPTPVCRHTSSVSAKQLPARMGVCKTGEEYCIRKGDTWDEPNTEPAIDNLGRGEGVTETSVYAVITVQRRSSAQLSSAQFSSVPRLATRPTAGVFRYMMAEMVKTCLSVLLMTVWMTVMMIQNCLAPETTGLSSSYKSLLRGSDL